MPKQKTHQGVKARFKVTKNGHVLVRRARRNHNLSKKNPATKRTFSTFKRIHGKMAKNIANEGV